LTNKKSLPAEAGHNLAEHSLAAAVVANKKD
jgi:hypothetical protein